jgi:nucleotide-binding universal stress UspA family protein
MINKILIAVDRSPPANRAIDMAIELAKELGAEVGAVHVVDSSLAYMPEYAVIDATKMMELNRIGRLALDEARARVPVSVQFEEMLVEGEPAEAIIETARTWRADLIVLGNDSRGRLAHFLLGSTADSVIRKASCPVVSVRVEDPVKKSNEQILAAV